MAQENYVEGCSMQRPPFLEADGFCFWKTHFETYIKSKDINLWQVIQNGDFVFMMGDLETKMEVETPYELLKDDQKKQLRKNNKAKMTLYNALPRKEYEQVFMCKTAKDVWHIFIITHQGNSQVKDCKIDLLTQKYKKLSISSEETIDTRFNAIVTSLKSFDQDYSRRNHVRKFLRALPLKWRAKVYEMILENDGVASKTTKEKVKSLALKAKVTKDQTTDDSDSQGGSDEDVDEEESEAFNLMARNFRKEVTVIISRTKATKAQEKGEVATNAMKKVTSLVSVQSPRRTRPFSRELRVIVKTVMNLKMTQLVSWWSTLKRLQDEALNFSKFKKSSIVLDDMLSRQKLSQDKEGIGFSKNKKTTSLSLNKPITFVKEGQNKAPGNSAPDALGDAPTRHQRATGLSKSGVSFNNFVKPVDPQTRFANVRGYSQTSKAYIVLNKETIRIKKSLNVTFDESFPEPKSFLSVKDDMINKLIVQDLNEPLSFLDEGYLKSLKEARGHPIEQVTGELKERTLRSKTKQA
ncbi:hypothetical protein Tco_1184095 [Tanacetum coccineum]